ncbi:MFS transporter [uncultured Rhodoblastus sp.]|uniref:MFS transporter n=1 Tax=uncultured Rhodoblastus sp. TaxID=543037 RepID=UPI0025FE9AA1|nr:MFS transporter [uncultured Rhodoblastus sp.]
MFAAFDSPTRKKLGAAISCISIVGVGLSLVIPLLALRMEAAGIPARTNGLHIAVTGFATLVAAPLTPPLARALGIRPALFLAIGVSVAALVAFAFVDDFRLWLAIRAVFGLALTVVFVISEFWIGAAAPRGQRGVVMGLYATVLAIGYSVGPTLLTLVGIEGKAPFLFAAGLISAAALPVALAGREGSVAMEGGGRGKLRPIFVAAPLAMAAGLFYGAVETGMSGLLPVFGLRAGMTPAWATFQLTLWALGNVVFPIPVGLIADRVNKIKLLGLLSLLGLIGALSLPSLVENRLAYAVALFVWGGIISEFYPVGLALLGEKFQGAQLGAANAAFVMTYALGMMVGPPMLGLGLDLSARHGLFDALALLFAGYLALVAVFAGPFAPGRRRGAA